MKKFETLKAQLGTGLIVSLTEQGHAECDFYPEDYDLLKPYKIVNIDFEHDAIYTIQSLDKGESYDDLDGEFIKPHLFNLSDLNKPIRVEGYKGGEEFVPINELFRLESFGYASLGLFNEWIDIHVKTETIERLPYLFTKMFDEWKINWRNLPASDYIDASLSKVYEPNLRER